MSFKASSSKVVLGNHELAGSNSYLVGFTFKMQALICQIRSHCSHVLYSRTYLSSHCKLLRINITGFVKNIHSISYILSFSVSFSFFCILNVFIQLVFFFFRLYIIQVYSFILSRSSKSLCIIRAKDYRCWPFQGCGSCYNNHEHTRL